MCGGERLASAVAACGREIDAQAQPDLAQAADKIIQLVPGLKQYFHEWRSRKVAMRL